MDNQHDNNSDISEETITLRAYHKGDITKKYGFENNEGPAL